MAKTGNLIRNIALGTIIFLLIIGLSIFGFTDMFSPEGNTEVGKVGNKSVTNEFYAVQFQRALQANNDQTGQRQTTEEAYNQGLATQLNNQITTQKLLEIDADKLGLGTANTLIRDFLGDIPVFQDEFSGEYSDAAVDRYLANPSLNVRQSRDGFIDEIAEDLRRQQLVRPLVAGVRAPVQYGEQRYRYLTEQRKVTVVTLNRDSVPAIETPEDEVLQQYLDDNAADYTEPEYRSFVLVRAEFTDFTPNVEVAEEDIVATYEAELETGKLGSAETRSLTYQAVTNEEIAERVKEGLAEGKDFETLATDLGLPEPIVYTDVTAGDVVQTSAGNAAFDAGVGDIASGEGKVGWYVIRLDGITPAEAPDLEAERERIVQELSQLAAEDALFTAIEVFENALDNGATIEDAGKEAELSVSHIGLISRRGITPDGKVFSGLPGLPGVARDNSIMTSVFTADFDYRTELVETDNDGYAMVRVTEIVESRKKDLDEVRADVTQAWIDEQTDEKVGDLALDMITRLRGGESLEDISATMDDGYAEEDRIFVRSTRPRDLAPEVLSQVLEGSDGEIFFGLGTEPLTRKIVIVDEVVTSAESLSGEFAQAMQMQASEELSSDIQLAYRQDLAKDNDVVFNEGRIRSVLRINP